MKKLICLLLLLSLTLSFVGCFSSDDKGNTVIETPLVKKTVRFVTNGGTSVSSKQVYTLNQAPSTTRNGYAFNGWYLDQTLSVPAVFPIEVDKDMTLYAKWLKIKDYGRFTDCSIKWGSGHSSALYYSITPNGFDLEELAKQGYYMKISVSYSVYYRKDYDVLWDIGYAGSPKYEVYLSNARGYGVSRENMSTTTSSVNRSIEMTVKVADMVNEKYKLTFSTDNIQNIIYFKNISVTYTAYK